MTFPHFLRPCLLHLIVLLQLARKDDLLPEASQLFPTVLGTAKWGVTAGLRGRRFACRAPTSISGGPSGPGLPRGRGVQGWGGQPADRAWQIPAPALPPRTLSTPGASRPPLPPPGHPARLPYPARGRRGCRTARAPAARGPRSCAPPCRSCWPRRTAATRTRAPHEALGSGGTQRRCRPPAAAGAASRPPQGPQPPGPRRPGARHRRPASRTAPAARSPLAGPSRPASSVRPPLGPEPRGARPVGPLDSPPGGLERGGQRGSKQGPRSRRGAQDAPPPSVGRKGGGAEPGEAHGRGREGGAARRIRG